MQETRSAESRTEATTGTFAEPDAAPHGGPDRRRAHKKRKGERRSPQGSKEERLANLQRRGAQGPGEPLDLSGQNLRRANLSGLDLSFVDLSGADLSQADLRDCTVVRANLSGCVLYQARLDRSEFTGSDLSRANFDRVQAAGTCFGMSDLRDASLFESDLRGATLTRANLTGADLRCANLTDARARESTLTQAVLDRAKLRNVDLEDAEVTGASFDEVDLRGSRLRRVSGFERALWIGADLRDIDFTGAYRLRRFAMDQNYLEEFRARGGWHRLVYRLWWLTSDCGRSVTRWTVFTLLVAAAFAGAFAFTDVDYGDHPTAISAFYYSVVTLTTLGYGDVLPVSTSAKILAMLEVLCGYMLVGGMLSIFANKMARRAE